MILSPYFHAFVDFYSDTFSRIALFSLQHFITSNLLHNKAATGWLVFASGVDLGRS